jgi:hypothetical protein
MVEVLRTECREDYRDRSGRPRARHRCSWAVWDAGTAGYLGSFRTRAAALACARRHLHAGPTG